MRHHHQLIVEFMADTPPWRGSPLTLPGGLQHYLNKTKSLLGDMKITMVRESSRYI